MSLLEEHFKRVRAAENRGFVVRPVAYFDCLDTTIDFDGNLIEPVTDFSTWNAQAPMPLFREQALFSRTVGHAEDCFTHGGHDPRDIGFGKLIDEKALVFNMAAAQGYMLECVVDDSPIPERYRPLVVTHLNPKDETVRRFFEEQQKKHFHHHAA